MRKDNDQCAAQLLEAKGLSARVIDMHTLKPLDDAIIERAAAETGALVTIEEHSIIGGLGSAVCEAVCRWRPVLVVRVGIPDRFGESGAYAEILGRAGVDKDHVVVAAGQAIALKTKKSG